MMDNEGREPSKRLRWLVFLLPPVLYLLAVNPYLGPSQYDDILFFHAAQSIVDARRFMFAGKFIVEYGPGLAWLLSIPMYLGIRSVVISKLLIVFSATAAIILGLRLFEREDRRSPALTILIGALTIESFLAAARVLTEWPFLAVAFGFLLLIPQMEDRRVALSRACLAGALLGTASLFRFIGVLLGAALIHQAVTRYKKGARLRDLAPEGLAAFVGGSIFVAWRIRNAVHTHNGMSYVRDHHLTTFLTPHPEVFLIEITRALTGIRLSLGITGISLSILVALGVVIGFVSRITSGRWKPSDSYVFLGCLMLLFYDLLCARHFVSFVPFLVDYLLEGVACVAVVSRRLGPQIARTGPQFVAVGWLLGCLAMDTLGITHGNGRTYGPLSPLLSPTATDYYRGYWRNLYEACAWVATNGEPGLVGVSGIGGIKHVIAFSGRPTVELPSRYPVRYALYDAPLGQPLPLLNTVPLVRFGDVVIYDGRMISH